MACRRIVLRFPHRLVNRPIVSDLVKRYELSFNILKAYVTPREEGLLILEITGSPEACEQGLQYLADMGVSVRPLSEEIVRNEDRCTHCGACVPVCPTGALSLDRDTMMVIFDNEKCMACELCITACPTRAMELHF